jgi:hypothetical protein
MGSKIDLLVNEELGIVWKENMDSYSRYVSWKAWYKARDIRIGLYPGWGSNLIPPEIPQLCLYTKLHIFLLSEGGCNMILLSYAHRHVFRRIRRPFPDFKPIWLAARDRETLTESIDLNSIEDSAGLRVLCSSVETTNINLYRTKVTFAVTHVKV